MKEVIVTLVTAVLGTVGFSILFFVHPRRLPVATLGGLLTCAVYLLVGHFLDGELVPTLVAAFVGAGYSEVCARLTKTPVPVYMTPAVIPLVPGGALYSTMFHLVGGAYELAGDSGLVTLQAAMGIAGGIVAASVLGLFLHPRCRHSQKMPSDVHK